MRAGRVSSVSVDGSKFKAVNNRDKNFYPGKEDGAATDADRGERCPLAPRQLDSADRQKPSEARETKTTRLKEKIAKLKEEMQRLHGLKTRMLAALDQQISLTDPDSRSMATSGRGSGVVGYNVQVAVDTGHHLIIAHEVTNVGSDRAQLARMAEETKATLEATDLDVIADRGYFSTRKCCAPLRTRRTTCSPSSTPSSTASHVSVEQTQATYVSPKKATRWLDQVDTNPANSLIRIYRSVAHLSRRRRPNVCY